MKKPFFLFIAAAAAVFTLASCEVEPVEAVDGDNLTTVYIHAGASKTTLDGKDVNWESSDAIKVCYAGGWNHMYQFTIDGTPSGGEATFKGEINVEAEAAVNPDIFVEALLYPFQGDTYNQVYASSGTLKGVTLPANQAFVDGSFASGVNVAVAPHSTGDFTFYSIGSIIAVPVTGDATIAKAVLKGNNGETLAGKYDVGINDRSLSNVTSGSSEITLTPSTPVSVSGGKTFVFVLAPTAFTSGFSIVFYDNDGKTFKKTYTASVETHTGKKATLNPVTVNAADFAEPFDPSGYNLAGTYSVMKQTSVNASNPDYTFNAYTMGSTIALASSTEYSASVGGRKYVLDKYNGYNGMYICFDLSDIEVVGKPGCYKLVNFQDRNGQDPIPDATNLSYYDSTTGYIYFDFVISGYWSKSGFCQLFYVAEDMSSVDVSGDGYTSTPFTSECFTATDNTTYNPGYGGIAPEIWLTSALEDYNTTYSCSVAPTNNSQKFFVCYKNSYKDQVLFFDISGLKVSGLSNCYYLTNLQDRGGNGSDGVVDGCSYYNAGTGALHFDFLVDGYWGDVVYSYDLTK